MNQFFKILILFMMFFSSCGGANSHESTDGTSENTIGSISGTVSIADSVPLQTLSKILGLNASAVSGIRVSVEGNETLFDDTDSNGYFIIQNVPSGTFCISASAETASSSTYSFRMCDITVGLTDTAIDSVVLAESGSVTGNAFLEGQNNYLGIEVYAAGTSYSAHTDDTGNFTISNIPASTYTIIFQYDGYDTQTVVDVSVISAESTRLDDMTLIATDASGSITGHIYLTDTDDHSGITISIGGHTATTASDGSYAVSSVTEGSYRVTFSYGLGCSPTGSVTGDANFADARSDKSGASVVLQYAPDCYVSEQTTGVVVFDDQNTDVADITLDRGDAARLTTTTDADGLFSFDSIPVGTYSGSLPNAYPYVQPIGTYALAIATSGLSFQYDDGRVESMRAYPNPEFRNDPFYQNLREITVSDSDLTDIGQVALYPSIFMTTTDAYSDDYPASGMDFSADGDVFSTDTNADAYLSFLSPLISINGSNNIQEIGEIDLQSVTTAPTSGYSSIATIDLTDEVDWVDYPDHYNQTYTAITKEGKYVKFKLLLSCGGDGDYGQFKCIDVLYNYQADGSASFSY